MAARDRGLHVIAFLTLLDPEDIIARARLGDNLAVIHLPAFDIFPISVGIPIIIHQPGYPESCQSVLLSFCAAARQYGKEYRHQKSAHYCYLEQGR